MVTAGLIVFQHTHGSVAGVADFASVERRHFAGCVVAIGRFVVFDWRLRCVALEELEVMMDGI